jgi:hypothetical protein
LRKWGGKGSISFARYAMRDRDGWTSGDKKS